MGEESGNEALCVPTQTASPGRYTKFRENVWVKNVFWTLDFFGKCGIIVTIIFYFRGFPDRQKTKEFAAWQVLDLARDGLGDGGRRSALRDLVSEDVHLEDIKLKDVRLSSADLRGASFSNSGFNNVNFEKTDFSCRSPAFLWSMVSNCRPSSIYWTTFASDKLDDTNFSGASILSSDFSDSFLVRGMRFDNATLSIITFERFGLDQCSFRGTHVANFQGKDFDTLDCDFTNSSWTDVQAYHSHAPSLVVFNDGDMTNASFKRVFIDSRPIAFADFPNAYLCGTSIDGVVSNRDCGKRRQHYGPWPSPADEQDP